MIDSLPSEDGVLENRASGVLSVRGLRKHFDVRRGMYASAARLFAVDGVSLDVHDGETLGLVGESGCGKSTLGRVVVGLMKPTEGSVRLRDSDVHTAPKTVRAPGALQMVFQDAAGSLNPRRR